ncbi:MAG: apurinic/apyrimidinic endonuclease family protein [Chloroflexota bacterium]
MPGTVAPTARVLLKGRPTEAQLADRLAEPVPAGLELYLDAEDIKDLPRLDRLARRLVELRPHPGFTYVVEGPLRSLDGSFFDISVNSESNRECLRRIALLAETVGAEAILIHAITPMTLDAPLGDELRRARLEASTPLIEYYVKLGRDRGLVPMVENIPPVARQRQQAYMVTPVGMSAHDLVYLARRFPGLKATVDLSHARLFLNALRTDPARVEPELVPLLRYLATLDDDPTMEGYLRTVEPYLFEIHVSNARGLLEEGLPYGDGDLDLDALAVRLGRSVRYLVTETIEPDPSRAVEMRIAQRRLEAAMATLPGTPPCCTLFREVAR